MWWESLVTLAKDNPKATGAVVVGVFLAGIAAGRWFVHAEDCHVKGEVAFEGVETLTRIREDELLRQQAQNEYLAELCRAGELPGKPVTCAKATAAMRASE